MRSIFFEKSFAGADAIERANLNQRLEAAFVYGAKIGFAAEILDRLEPSPAPPLGYELFHRAVARRSLMAPRP